MRHVLLFSSLLTLASVACDPPSQCLDEGTAWGPCRPEGPPAGCDPGLYCLEGVGGSMCTPQTCESCVTDASQKCASAVGKTSCAPILASCVIRCLSDADCNAGTFCDDRHKICLWPGPTAPPPTLTTGPAMTTGG